jgi:hypothetical protein
MFGGWFGKKKTPEEKTPEEKYAEQLAQLHKKGYKDDKKNLAQLELYNGDVNLVVIDYEMETANSAPKQAKPSETISKSSGNVGNTATKSDVAAKLEQMSSATTTPTTTTTTTMPENTTQERHVDAASPPKTSAEPKKPETAKEPEIEPAPSKKNPNPNPIPMEEEVKSEIKSEPIPQIVTEPKLEQKNRTNQTKCNATEQFERVVRTQFTQCVLFDRR